jgi:hypothetical protein
MGYYLHDFLHLAIDIYLHFSNQQLVCSHYQLNSLDFFRLNCYQLMACVRWVGCTYSGGSISNQFCVYLSCCLKFYQLVNYFFKVGRAIRKNPRLLSVYLVGSLVFWVLPYLLFYKSDQVV